MYYRISDLIAFRSFADLGFAYYKKGGRSAIPLSKKEASVLLLADGMHDLDTDETVLLLVMKRLMEPCSKGEVPSEWSAFRSCENPYFPMMNLMITGKCNFNCLHCFNAADNDRLNTEWSFEEICAFLDQARDCGVAGFTITGGEPMLHRRFLDIIREIYQRGMMVFSLNTNGSFLNQEVLDELKKIGCCPEIKISLDGIGTHDWMRRCDGAEKAAVDSMKLCIENGFRVVSNTQVNRRNLHTMMATAKLLNSIGVPKMRIIRTTEVPRWEENAPDACLSLEEYYGSMLDFAAEYIKSGMEMHIHIWQYLGLLPREKCYYLHPVKYAAGEYQDCGYCCNCTHTMIAVTSSGEIMPCNQMSGFFLKHSMSFGNVHQTPLKDLLNSREYLKVANMTAKDLRAAGGKCAECPYFHFCGGGCRALGYLFADQPKTFAREDVTKCYFFENGWYQKITKALSPWTNQSEIRDPFS